MTPHSRSDQAMLASELFSSPPAAGNTYKRVQLPGDTAALGNSSSDILAHMQRLCAAQAHDKAKIQRLNEANKLLIDHHQASTDRLRTLQASQEALLHTAQDLANAAAGPQDNPHDHAAAAVTMFEEVIQSVEEEIVRATEAQQQRMAHHDTTHTPSVVDQVALDPFRQRLRNILQSRAKDGHQASPTNDNETPSPLPKDGRPPHAADQHQYWMTLTLSRRSPWKTS